MFILSNLGCGVQTHGHLDEKMVKYTLIVSNKNQKNSFIRFECTYKVDFFNETYCQQCASGSTFQHQQVLVSLMLFVSRTGIR